VVPLILKNSGEEALTVTMGKQSQGLQVDLPAEDIFVDKFSSTVVNVTVTGANISSSASLFIYGDARALSQHFSDSSISHTKIVPIGFPK